MPIGDNPFSLTEDQSVDIGEEAFRSHIKFIAAAYKSKPIVRAYLCGCLAVLTHWLIKECGSRQAFAILTEMADLAVKSDLPE
jgi:hypothetical protein